jgi:threonine/homoserine/homoserine lactone efflux protein
MGQVLGDVLPLAIGVAIAPIPIVAVILMLLGANAGGASTGFLAGWALGIAAATTVTLLAAGALARTGSRPAAAAWTQLALGVLLLLLAVRRWRSRPRRGQEPLMPGWMAVIDRFGAVRAAGIGVALVAVNPKNLLLCVAAGTAIAGGDLSAAQNIVAVTVFTVVAASTVAVPVAGFALGRKRVAGRLQALRGWLTVHSDAVLATLLLIIGAMLIGDGLSALG